MIAERSAALTADTPREAADKRTLYLTFGAYFAFFAALFAQFPLQNALPGNCDTVLLIELSNTLSAKIGAFLGFREAGHALYPVQNIIAYGEAAYGTGFFFLLFRWMGFGDITAYYLYITSVFALTAVATYAFAGLFVRSYAARLFAGFAFTCSNIAFAHIDDAFHVFYFFPIISLTYLLHAFREGSRRRLYMAAILGGLQPYFSMYIFIYQTIFLAAVMGYRAVWQESKLAWRDLIKASLLYLGIAAPLVAFYSWVKLSLNIVPVYDPPFITRVMSWQPTDAILALPNNLLYGWITWMPQNWPQLRHHNLIGLLIIVSAIGALFRRGQHRVILGGMALIAFVLSLGPVVMWGLKEVAPTPLYPLYQWIPIFAYHRIPVRAYIMFSLALSVLAAVALEFLLGRVRGRWAMGAILTAFVAIHIVENVPFPLRAYKLGARLQMPSEYSFFADKKDAIILELPSRFGFIYKNWDPELFYYPRAFIKPDPGLPKLEVRDWDSVALSSQELFLYNRDMFYMNWQTQHRKNIVNGVHGYFPAPRLIFEHWILDLPSERALLWMREQGVRYISYHHDMLLPGDVDILPALEATPLLRKVVTGERSIIFEFVESGNP